MEAPIFEQEFGNLVMYKSVNEGHGDSSVFNQNWLANLPSAQQTPFPSNTAITPNATHSQPPAESAENTPVYFSDEFVPDFFGSIGDASNASSSQNDLGNSTIMAPAQNAFSYSSDVPPLDNDLWASAPYSFGSVQSSLINGIETERFCRYQDWGEYMAKVTQSNPETFREPDR